MDAPKKFVLPAPNFGKSLAPCMTKQPPPMYGPKGSTIPPKFLQNYNASKPAEEPPKPKPYCESCEMELQSAEDFRRHRAQHEPCPVDGCKFKGHPNVMDKHVMELHASGIFDKIKKLSTPEEIAAWREERRKKYPTLANAKMRQLAQEQRERRGERLMENKARFGRHEDRKRARPEGRRSNDFESSDCAKKKWKNEKQKSLPNQQQDKRNQKPNEKKLKAENLVENKNSKIETSDELLFCGIRKFGGTSQMADYKHEKANVEKNTNVLASLVGMYGSDDDDDDDDDDDNAVDEQSEKSVNILMENAKTKDDEQEILKEKSIIEDKSIMHAVAETETLQNEAVDIEISKEKTEAATEIEVACFAKLSHETKAALTTTTSQQLAENEAKRICISAPPTDQTTTPAESKIQSEVVDDQKNESSDEAPEETPILRTTTMPTPVTTDNASTTPTETIEAKRKRIEQTRKRLQAQRSHQFSLRQRRIRRQNTMLEKLLEPEIRHERNVLLQCVRYVCENNFFGIGNESVKSGEETKSEAI